MFPLKTISFQIEKKFCVVEEGPFSPLSTFSETLKCLKGISSLIVKL